MTTTSTDAKAAARQRVRAFLKARETYALNGGIPPLNEVARQTTVAHVNFTATFAGNGTLTGMPERASVGVSDVEVLLASDLALLAADDD